MGDERVLLERSINDFFERSGLTSQDQNDCAKYVEILCSRSRISLPPSQGYCSLTVFVDDDKVIQFRPHCYQLDLRVTQAAREVYGSFAPDTKYLGMISKSTLHVYGMDRISGISFRDLRAYMTPTAVHLAGLCKDLALFLSRAWHRRGNDLLLLGPVGKSIKQRLESLIVNLPSRFQTTAKRIAQNMYRVDALPLVITHGDIAAANIMVDPISVHLLGFVDWAEAESLPFGTCLYGLEEILGRMTPSGFQYHPDASALRDMFWAELMRLIPELQQSDMMEAVKLARDLGVLLWHGIAFDNGAINRVVEEGRDDEEICRLDSFLDVKKAHPTSVSKF